MAERDEREASGSNGDVYVLETPRLALRNWKVEDAPAAFAVYGDPRVTALQSQAPYATVEEARARIVEQRKLIEARGFGHWAMVERDGDKPLVGSCGFRTVEGSKVLEIGFTVSPSRWGHGYGIEIVTACARYGLERLGAPRIIALTSPMNLPAQRVLEKSGMKASGEKEDEGLVWKVYALDPA